LAEWERTGSAQFGCLYWEKGVSTCFYVSMEGQNVQMNG